jgi:hypothetical protein
MCHYERQITIGSGVFQPRIPMLYTLSLNGGGMGGGDVKVVIASGSEAILHPDAARRVIARSKATKQSQNLDRRDFPVPHHKSSFPEGESIYPPPELGRDRWG